MGDFKSPSVPLYAVRTVYEIGYDAEVILESLDVQWFLHPILVHDLYLKNDISDAFLEDVADSARLQESGDIKFHRGKRDLAQHPVTVGSNYFPFGQFP